eukprot:1158357-Pelagomonas_calceolata.AAC.6
MAAALRCAVLGRHEIGDAGCNRGIYIEHGHFGGHCIRSTPTIFEGGAGAIAAALSNLSPLTTTAA